MDQQNEILSPDCTVSVIIPALNEADNISRCVQAARGAYSPEQVEVIVVDGGSTDATLQHIPPDVTIIQTSAGRAHQMNAGAKTSSGEVLVFCHADTRLSGGWREKVIAALNQPGVSGGAFQTRLEPETGIMKWMNKVWLPADWRYIYGDQVMFLRRSTFETVGGFPEIVLMEDVEMARSIAKIGKTIRVRGEVYTDSRRMIENGVLRQLLGNIWRMIRYLYLGATPDQIAGTYHSSREASHE